MRVFNYTNFFNRELFMYSLGDIKFKKPVSLKKVGYTTMFIIIWTLPLYFLIGLPTGPLKAFIMIGLPVVAGHFAAKPVFGGKGLADYFKTLVAYIGEPKGWADQEPLDKHGSQVFKVENEIWIGRRRELRALADDRISDLA